MIVKFEARSLLEEWHQDEEELEDRICDDDSNYVPYPIADTQFDYTKFVHARKPIAHPMPNNVKRVAIIGGGASGLCAAYELSRIGGIKPDIFEATDRVGGRLWTQRFEGDNVNQFEMGAMRMPQIMRLYWQYVKRFGLRHSSDFPNPFKVPLCMNVDNHEYYRPPDEVKNPSKGQSTGPAYGGDGNEALLKQIERDLFAKDRGFFAGFIHKYKMAHQYDYRPSRWNKHKKSTDDLPAVPDPKELLTYIIWQDWLKRFAHQSFYQVIHEHMTKAPYNWTETHFYVFGTLGVGCGGYSSFYTLSFIDMLRIIVFRYVGAPMSVMLDGVDSITDKFHEFLKETGININLGCPVTSIEKNQDNGKLVLKFAKCPRGRPTDDKYEYDAVIVTATTRAMQSMGLTESPLLSRKVKRAIRMLHLVNASKLFIRTDTKFWEPESGIQGVPYNIQSDGLTRGTYCLSYDKSQPNQPGVVLLSYTWGDDSTKLLYTGSGNDKDEASQEKNDKAKVDRYRMYYDSLKRSATLPDATTTAETPSICNFVKHLPDPDKCDEKELAKSIFMVDWQAMPYQQGAYKVNMPGQEHMVQDVYYQYRDGDDSGNDTGLYLAGDTIGWTGGWIETALETGINAAAAVVKRFGGSFYGLSPTDHNRPKYAYF